MYYEYMNGILVCIDFPGNKSNVFTTIILTA